jgi:hypothetical protein
MEILGNFASGTAARAATGKSPDSVAKEQWLLFTHLRVHPLGRKETGATPVAGRTNRAECKTLPYSNNINILRKKIPFGTIIALT